MAGLLGTAGKLLRYRHYIFDIEGTTTPISFVKDVLFPFARSQLREFLTNTWANSQTQADVSACFDWANDVCPAEASAARSSADSAQQIEFLAGFLERQIDADSKHGALKQLQGHMWKGGYEQGTLKSIVYEDVPACFANIVAPHNYAHVSIYSSGSRQAQHLLFKYTNAGDLRPMIHSYFDTAVGHKRDAQSYENILLTLGYDASDDLSVKEKVLFVTDILEEAQAAVKAGMSAVISVRPGNAALPEGHGFPCVTSFDQLE
jgi:methylthioribulose 1-phosphate dehydratase/enolase-phosphatase E1